MEDIDSQMEVEKVERDDDVLNVSDDEFEATEPEHTEPDAAIQPQTWLE